MNIFENVEQASELDISQYISTFCDNELVHVCEFGKSVCGRPLRGIQIGEMNKPTVFVGGTHSLEWISVFICLMLASDIVESIKQNRTVYGIDYHEALLKNGVVIVPLLNPDGYEIFKSGPHTAYGKQKFLSRFDQANYKYWQANANGVDLNRNFNAGFYKAKKMVDSVGVTRPAPTRYGGILPFSEPETRAIRKLCAQIQPRSLYALHSQGEEIYWRYGNNIPFGSEYIGTLLSSLSGYTLTSPDRLASHAGLKDWFIKAHKKPGFTIELGLGRNPLPYDCLNDVWQRVRRALFVATIV